MKRATFITLLLGITLLQGCGVLFESPEDKAARQQREFQTIRESVESGNFKIDIRQMIPLQMSPRHVTNYSVSVKDNHIISYLPYAGRAWDVPYGGGHALNFQADIQETAVYRDDVNGSYTVRLLIRTDEDTHVYTFQIFSSGSASLLVQSKNRDSISYNGEFVFDDDNE
ncbi:MAG: DUF4251 domain-containing protein [Bacteroidales bacterium]|nr:DUF4251 domain-containing protein [Bacteroidales bacterium]MBR4227754.1 DUF4251 domain-containing protein [Bacteroidales bacterium]